ncbi:MAG: sugar phosphate isomerase/epimerase [Bacteroidia bacterium]
MQLGFVSAILPDLHLEEILCFAAETGYDCVEVMCWPPGKAERRYAGVTHIDVTAFGEDEARQVRSMIEQFGVHISALGYYPNPLTPHQEESDFYVAHIRKVIEAAARLGIDRVNTFIGRDWQRSIDDNWPRFLEVWKPLIQFAETHKVRIGIENCPMIFSYDEWPGGKNLAQSPAVWRRMFADIASDYFGLNYDPSHLVWQHMDYLKPIREFGSRFFHVHAKDVRLDQHRLDEVGIMVPPLQYHSPKLPGLGEVNWGKFFSELSEVSYTGPVCVEVEDRAYEGSLGQRKAALTQSHTYLRQFCPKR